MSDIIDDANERAEQFLKAALSKRRAGWLKITGHCHYCSEGTPAGRLFCDTECRDAYDDEKRLNEIAGA